MQFERSSLYDFISYFPHNLSVIVYRRSSKLVTSLYRRLRDYTSFDAKLNRLSCATRHLLQVMLDRDVEHAKTPSYG